MGRTLTTRYREHIQAIKTNKQTNKCAQHILDTGQTNDTIEETTEVLHMKRVNY
jgi:hypothetical protein